MCFQKACVVCGSTAVPQMLPLPDLSLSLPLPSMLSLTALPGRETAARQTLAPTWALASPLSVSPSTPTYCVSTQVLTAVCVLADKEA